MTKNSWKTLLLILIVLPGIAQADTSVISQNINAAFDVTIKAFQAIGFFLFGHAWYRVSSSSKPGGRQATPGAIILEGLAGVVLISIGWFYSLFKNSLLGANAEGVDFTDSGSFNLAIDASAAAAATRLHESGFGKFLPQDTFQMIIGFLFLYGILAFGIGWMKLKDVPEDRGGGGYAKPAFMILGGVLCMNILWFGCLVGSFMNVPAMCAN